MNRQRSPLLIDNTSNAIKRPRNHKWIIILSAVILLILLCFLIYVLFIDNIFEKETNDSLTDADIAKFIETIDGNVYQSPDSEYNQTLSSIWNQRQAFNPILIVFALTTNDIVNTLDFVKKYSLSFSILGGGHNSVGWSINSGVVLSMQHFKNISIINTTNTSKALSIGAGNRWYNVYNYMIDNNISSFIITGGLCPFVGIVGFTLGGGINGVCSREFGLNIDNVLEYELITANGLKYILNNDTVKQDNNLQNLWWALSGGGGNNFGIVTNIVVKLHEPNAVSKAFLVQYFRITAFNESYIDSLVDLLAFYHGMQEDLPIFIATFMQTYFENNNLLFLLRIGCNNDREICYNLLEPFYNYLNGTNMVYTLEERYDNFVDALVGYTNDIIPQYNDKIYLKSGYILNEGFESNIWNITLNAMIKNAYYPYNRTRMFFEQLGGKVSDIENDETAYFRRQNVAWVCQILGSYLHDNIEERNGVIEWINMLYNNVTQYLVGAYVNYMDEYLLDWNLMYYGTNYQKLQCVKELYDPINVFTFEQSIQLNRSLSCNVLI